MKILIVACLLAVAVANEPSYSKPDYLPTARYQNPTENYAPMPYSFDWSVYDQASYNDYSHQANSDGKGVTGSYRVLLPDSRVQIVTYKADEYGYVADVKYEGEAKYDAKSYTGNAYRQSNSPSEYAAPGYKPKEYSPSQYPETYSTTYKPQAAYPAKPYNAEVYPSKPYEAQAYPAKYASVKQYNDQEYRTNEETYPAGKQYPESYVKPGYKAAPTTYVAPPTYRQPNYPAEIYVSEYATPKAYEAESSAVYSTKDY